MAYIINKFNGQQLIVLEDGTIDTSTSLGLVGRNYVGYGETQNENFVYLLENFANDAPPSRPLLGQIWFNTADNLANVYDGTNWNPIGAAKLSTTAPLAPNAGSLWLDTTTSQLKIWTGEEWGFIGPEAVAGFGITRARSTSLDDSDGNTRPVIFLETDDIVIAICTAQAFTINPNSSVTGFSNNLIAGINLSSTSKIKGDVAGNATSADKLSNPRLINNTAFDGQNNITIKAATTNKLVKGTYIAGSDFDGSSQITWSVDATPSNVIGKVVARNSEGGFSAGTITATFVGDLTGNVSTLTGTSKFNVVEANTFVGATLTGNAFSASQLATPRRINGVSFSGTSDITVTAAAETLTGNQLNSTVTQSSLTVVGTLVNLSVANAGISVGNSSQITTKIDTINVGGPLVSMPSIDSRNGDSLAIRWSNDGNSTLIFASASLMNLIGDLPNSIPAIVPNSMSMSLGSQNRKFTSVYSDEFKGNADTATLATRSTNLVGGGAGAIPYQTAANTTAMLGLGAAGTVLTSQAGGTLSWLPISREPLRKGSYLTLINTGTSGPILSYDGQIDATLAVDASSSNVASKIVARDSNGNFAAGTITANLTGNVSGNSSTASTLQTARLINGVAFNGSADITVPAIDSTKVAKSGDSMSGYLTLNANPVNALHAAPKQYVDSRLPQYTIISGASYSTSGFTNQVGSFNDGANFFDVFPPSGKSMGNLVAFIPSIHVIHYAGGVNGDDSMRCTYSYLADRIRVYVQNTEQRSTPAANYLVIWS